MTISLQAFRRLLALLTTVCSHAPVWIDEHAKNLAPQNAVSQGLDNTSNIKFFVIVTIISIVMIMAMIIVSQCLQQNCQLQLMMLLSRISVLPAIAAFTVVVVVVVVLADEAVSTVTAVSCAIRCGHHLAWVEERCCRRFAAASSTARHEGLSCRSHPSPDLPAK